MSRSAQITYPPTLRFVTFSRTSPTHSRAWRNYTMTPSFTCTVELPSNLYNIFNNFYWEMKNIPKSAWIKKLISDSIEIERLCSKTDSSLWSLTAKLTAKINVMKLKRGVRIRTALYRYASNSGHSRAQSLSRNAHLFVDLMNTNLIPSA